MKSDPDQPGFADPGLKIFFYSIFFYRYKEEYYF